MNSSGNSLQGKAIRNSNIEILRIISMFCILAGHAGRKWYFTEMDLPFDIYFTRRLYGSWGIVGVEIFVIISAYFLIDQNFRVKRLINLTFQTFTYVFGFFLASIGYILYNGQNVTSNLKQLLYSNFTKIWNPLWASEYWFITAYFFLLLLSPFLNVLIKRSNRSLYKKLLLILIFAPLYSQYNSSLSGDILVFCFIYLAVGYVKKYGSSLLSKYAKVRYIIALMFVITISGIIIYLPIPDIIKEILKNTTSLTSKNSIIIIILAFLIFFTVINKKSTSNKFINSFASYTLGVYLFHENCLFGLGRTVDEIIQKFFDIGYLDYSPLFPLTYLSIIILIYLTCILIEFLRTILIQKPFMNFISKKYSKQITRVDSWFCFE